ncbi:hypothetical protein AVEN_133267-1 [Araneus ventricosus]|uniref:Uncharacterized protein n=1 Tax=Araneus ventricosus TaxID=182803 RepID=A0A4Y2DLV4_ARAVE|nr:hypothetical protein AVEN_133267-1 [Araneus ventricosus]
MRFPIPSSKNVAASDVKWAKRCFESLRFSGSFGILGSSSIQGRDENHSSLCLGYSRMIIHVPFKLLQKLLGYNSIVRAGVVMNEENSSQK